MEVDYTEMIGKDYRAHTHTPLCDVLVPVGILQFHELVCTLTSKQIKRHACMCDVFVCK